MACKYWSELSTTDFENLNVKNTIAIMPVGSTEQHGPHLPLGVDVRIPEGVLKSVIDKIDGDIDILILPTLPIGKANEHIGFKGTLSLSINTLISLWTEVAESVFRTGIKKLLILNGHGGQTQVTEIVARDLRVRYDALVVPINWWSVRDKPQEFDQTEYTYGIHGGAEETSAMIYLHSNLVKADYCKNFQSNPFVNREKFPRLFSQGVKHAWKAEDLHIEGAMGDASVATAAKGKEIVENAAISIAELITEMIEYELPN